MASKGRRRGDKATRRNLEVLGFIEGYIVDNGWPPSVREICANFGWSGTNAAIEHLLALEYHELIRRGPGNRQIVVLE